MKKIKLLILTAVFTFVSSIVFSAEKADCTKINTNTGSGLLKKALCKTGSDKLDKDGNFKKGTFNLFKKLKKG